MSKHKIAKYKIIDTNIDKKFIGKQVIVEKIMSKGSSSINNKKPAKSKAPAWFNDFINNRFNKLENDVSNLKNDVSNLRSDVSNLRTDVSNLKNDVSNLNDRFDNLVKVNRLKE